MSRRVVRSLAVEDAGVRARVDGKTAIAARTVWALEVGGARFRCLREQGGYVVQARTRKGWTAEVCKGPDAAELLRQVACSKPVVALIAPVSGS